MPAPASGVFAPEPLTLGGEVTRGDLLGRILSVGDLSATEVRTPASGRVFRLGATHDTEWEQTRMFLHPHVEKGQVAATVVSKDGN